MAVSKRRSGFSDLLTAGAAIGLGLVTLLSLSGPLGRLHWSLDLTTHFKCQYLAIGIACLGFFGFWRTCRWRNWLLGLSICCIALNLVDIAPWYLPQRLAASPTVQLRLLHSNVLVSNRNYASVIALVREVKPDIAIFQEVNAKWLQKLEAIRDVLPYTYAEPNSVSFGNVIFSALPLQQPSVKFFGQTEYASIVAQISKGGQTLLLLTTHPPPPIRKELFHWRNQLLAAIVPYVRAQKFPVAVIGDLNISMWSPYYRYAVNAAGLRNSRVGFGILPSWAPRRWLAWLAIPIDHCLVSPEIAVLKTQIGRNVGSDHLPLIVDLAMPKG